MLLELFVIGSFWFWILILGMLCSLTVSVRRDSGFGATGTLVFGSLALWLFGNFNVFSWLYHHPVLFAIGLVAYFIIGVIWVFVKWEVYVRDRNNAVIEARATFLKGTKTPTVTTDTICIEDFNDPTPYSQNPHARKRDGTTVRPTARNGVLLEISAETAAAAKVSWEKGCINEVERIYTRFNDRLLDHLGYASLVETNAEGIHSCL